MSNAGVVRIPSRFEALRDAVGSERVAQVLLEPTADLAPIKSALVQIQASGQSKLLFLLGRSGSGKTSLAEGLRTFLPSVVAVVLTPPPDFDLPIDQLAQWLSRELPSATSQARGRIVVVNLDGREVPATNQAVTDAAMVNLNALLRRTRGVLAVWPIVNAAFASNVVGHLSALGGQSALTQGSLDVIT